MGEDRTSTPKSGGPPPGKQPPAPTPPAKPGGGPTDTAARVAKLSGRYTFRLGMVVGALITTAVVLLIVQNSESVEVQWLAFEFRTRLWTVLLVTLAAGGVVWEMARLGVRRSRNRARERKDVLRQAKKGGPAAPGGERVKPRPKP